MMYSPEINLRHKVIHLLYIAGLCWIASVFIVIFGQLFSANIHPALCIIPILIYRVGYNMTAQEAAFKDGVRTLVIAGAVISYITLLTTDYNEVAPEVFGPPPEEAAWVAENQFMSGDWNGDCGLATPNADAYCSQICSDEDRNRRYCSARERLFNPAQTNDTQTLIAAFRAGGIELESWTDLDPSKSVAKQPKAQTSVQTDRYSSVHIRRLDDGTFHLVFYESGEALPALVFEMGKVASVKKKGTRYYFDCNGFFCVTPYDNVLGKTAWRAFYVDASNEPLVTELKRYRP